MSDSEPFAQRPIPSGLDDIFVLNAQPRCPCVLLLDSSSSMRGEPITQLNDGLVLFKDELAADDLASKRVEIACISFGPVTVDNAFVGASDFIPPRLQAEGDTPMGAAIMSALDLVDERKGIYRRNGISSYRPWIFLVTDGGPTDAWKEAAARVRAAEEADRIIFFAVGVRGARMDLLAQISVRPPAPLEGLRFRDMFLWLSSSLKAVSGSRPGDKVALPPPRGWTSV
jgi:uncharacterized protein YegL